VQLEKEMNPVDRHLAEKDLKRLHDDIRKVLSTPEGRAFVYSVFVTFGLRRNCFSGNGSEMAFRCGKQAVTEWIFDRIVESGSYDLYSLMEKEYFVRQDEIAAEKKKLVENLAKGR